MDRAADRTRLREGTPVVFVDARQRLYYDHLAAGATSPVRGDRIAHDEAIGREDGCAVRSTGGSLYHVLSATLPQHVLHMQRHAQIVYPKDIAVLLLWGDVSPGRTVIEGGFGSGALTAALLRAVGPTGRVVTYELQESAVNRAGKNVRALLGACPNHEVRLADIYQGIEATDVDCVMLDVPEPWMVVPHAEQALRGGGVFAAYLPTVLQVQQLALALHQASFELIETIETLFREWHVTARSVRPEQQMIGHTGFLVFARKVVR